MTEQKTSRATFEKVLQAATDVFAEQGFDGARVDTIANRAAVNKATLYYQVGGKQALYEAVLDRVLGQTADAVEQAIAAADDAAAGLHALAGAILARTRDSRHFPAIVLREMATGGRNMPAVGMRHVQRIIGALRRVLAQGVDEGRFRPVNPTVIHFMFMGSIVLYGASAPLRERAPDLPDDSPPGFLSMDEHTDQVVELLISALGIKEKQQ